MVHHDRNSRLTTQQEYDQIHGLGAFARLVIPSFAERSRTPDAFLPATPGRPRTSEPFRAIPSLQRPEATDLGVWNIFANPDMPRPQNRLRRLLCRDGAENTPACTDAVLLNRAIAAFKTPGLRDLGHSAPCMHAGQFDTLEDGLRFYQFASTSARQGTLRNAAPALRRMAFGEEDVVALAAFLRALHEDYN